MERKKFIALAGLGLTTGCMKSVKVEVNTSPESGPSGRFYPAVTQKSPLGHLVIHDRSTYVEQYKYDHWTDLSLNWKSDCDLLCDFFYKWGQGVIPAQHRPAGVLEGLWLLGPEDYHQSIYLWDTGAGLLLVDPSYTSFQPQIETQVRELGYALEDVKWVLLTHMHFDHSEGAAAWERRGAKVYIGKGDEPYVMGQIKAEAADIPDPVKAPQLVTDDEELVFGKVKMKAIATPGHTPGSTCFSLQHDGKSILISGDIVLDFGRHAWMGASYCNWDQYLAGLWKLYNHPDSQGWQVLLPGHGTLDLEGARDSLYQVLQVVSEIIRRRRAGEKIDWLDPYELFWRRKLEGKGEIEPLKA